MGTYNLQYGYFALGGQSSEAEGEFNAKRIDKMETFVGFMKNYQQNVPELRDAKKKFIKSGFSILNDDQDINTNSLKNILIDGRNIGLLVYDIGYDVLNGRKKYDYNYRAAVYDFCSLVAAKKIDIYSMENDLYPISTNVLKRHGSRLFSYLGDNVVRNYAKCVRFKKSIDDDPHDDVFKYAGRRRVIT